MKSIGQSKCIRDAEKEYEWEKWREEIPYIDWPDNFLLKAVPPIGGAVIRYWVKDKNKKDSWVSVYLDCYNEIGFMDYPYWEIYPINGDCERFAINETSELVDGIKRALNEQ